MHHLRYVKDQYWSICLACGTQPKLQISTDFETQASTCKCLYGTLFNQQCLGNKTFSINEALLSSIRSRQTLTGSSKEGKRSMVKKRWIIKEPQFASHSFGKVQVMHGISLRRVKAMISWWCLVKQMLLLAICGRFPSQRSSSVKLWCFLCCKHDKSLNKQLSYRWFERSCSRSLFHTRNLYCFSGLAHLIFHQ